MTVTLVGGSKITANLLRESPEGVVLDLGFDVLNVPAKRVLDIQPRQDGRTQRREPETAASSPPAGWRRPTCPSW